MAGIKEGKKDCNCVEVLNLAAKYCSPTMKGEFLITPNI
jgi:hypothetical protein